MGIRGYREISRDTDWGTTSAQVTLEQINAGSLLRIADALEKMATPFERLLKDRKFYEEQYRQSGIRIGKLERSIAGMRGYINRVKKKK